jgi:hypothetical protein
MVFVPSVLAPWKKWLSVACLEAEHETKPLSALHQRDQRALSLVFAFAATRVIRSVTMFYGD